LNRWIQTRDEHKFTEYKTVRNAVKRETIKLIQLKQQANSKQATLFAKLMKKYKYTVES